MAIIADFMLVYLPAPTVALRPPLTSTAGPIAKFFHGCPDNAFQVFITFIVSVKSWCLYISSHVPNFLQQVALSGTSYSLIQRIGAIVVCTSIW